MPSSLLPETTLRAVAVVPPMVFVPELTMRMPLAPLPSAASPLIAVPI
jgi:hypothetical protein